MDNRQDLDARLREPGQEAVRNLVASLPEDEPSLAWRAQLNERLMREAPRRRPKFGWVLRPVAAVGLACAAYFAFLAAQPSKSGSLEETLVRLHQAAQMQDGLGTVTQVSLSSSKTPQGENWQETDLELL